MATKKRKRTFLDDYGKQLGLGTTKDAIKWNQEQSIINGKDNINYNKINQEQQKRVQNYKNLVEKEKKSSGLLLPTEIQDLTVSTFASKNNFGVPRTKSYLEQQREKATGHEIKKFSLYDDTTENVKKFNQILDSNSKKIRSINKIQKFIINFWKKRIQVILRAI